MLHMNNTNSTIDPVVKDTASLKRRWFDDDDECDESPALALRHDLDAITRLMAMITELDSLRKRRREC
ncbi:hypothetical protein SPRG_21668 [Saprolegnia parasitica CBS 223.65]|uniref:Uncharacterized protein n=1 Tax=Saprolegnia parasitica (strain CBS 223.65) TaxID=695850 RepID=A0A067BVI1_SAPPC|nr:hypothetical protein SPRG_21668 [Saprolegnia parasitica CBS 223.65]KDO18617.1 hypothetical protein SPRG_21668 [Saprolegnia parasitica CBS 223.65]|eukprot:XP_012210663.1 hypothetical protein SPRG_21668 [Saprolegnia parasitica CBS 223.65]